MRNLALLALLFAAGCIGEDDEGGPEAYCGDGIRNGHETCDDGNRDDTDGCPETCGLPADLFVDWSIQNAAGDSVTCDALADTARIRVQPYDESGPEGAEQTYIAPCNVHQLVITPRIAEVYMVIVELVVAADSRFVADSQPVRVDDRTGSLAHAVITIP